MRLDSCPLGKRILCNPTLFLGGEGGGAHIKGKDIPLISTYCGRAVSGTAIRTALVYYCIHSSLYTGTVHYTVYNGAGVRSTVAVLGLAMNQGRRQPPQSDIQKQEN
jgi:hypothetical protein